ncbi:carbamoyltransferase C-terminal domain-containing protein [Desulfovibrio caledoniensis]
MEIINMSVILGLGGSSHDYSAVLSINGKIVVGIEDERITRRKHGLGWWFEIPCRPSVEYCLNAAGMRLEQIDYIVAGDILPHRTISAYPDIEVVNHHLLHAASIYHYSWPDEMAVLVIDGGGAYTRRATEVGMPDSRETISFFNASPGGITLLGRTLGESLRETDAFSRSVSNSLGYLYNMVSHIIGFGKRQEGKTMGLAGYGKPVYSDTIKQHIRLTKSFDKVMEIQQPADELIGELVEALSRRNDGFTVRADLAASVQVVFEDVLIHCAELLMETTGSTHLGLAGGCALNAVANGILKDRLAAHGASLHLLPFVNDAGQAYGAVSWKAWELNEGELLAPKNSTPSTTIVCPGKHYTNQDILAALNDAYPRIEFALQSSPSHTLAQLLARGEIIGFYTDGSEFGPRALGNRSILANPTLPRIRERLNRDIKGREPFRPIAPIILEHEYARYFEGSPDSYYMINTARVKMDASPPIPAVTHVDGSARVQVLYESFNPLLFKTIEQFDSLTGCPVICNTSFNGPGEPIVETPEHAIDCFLRLGLDYLYLQGYLVWLPETAIEKSL